MKTSYTIKVNSKPAAARNKQNAYIKIGDTVYKRVYPVHVDPKLRTAYTFFERAVKRYDFETDDDVQVSLKQRVDAEYLNVLRVAFGGES